MLSTLLQAILRIFEFEVFVVNRRPQRVILNLSGLLDSFLLLLLPIWQRFLEFLPFLLISDTNFQTLFKDSDVSFYAFHKPICS